MSFELEPIADLSDTAESALTRAIARLEALLDAETEALRAGAPVDFDTLNLRKSHALLEFARLSRNFSERPSREAETRLSNLRGRLDVNAALLSQHLRAMTEIAELVIDSIRKQESDGTYSRGSAARR